MIVIQRAVRSSAIPSDRRLRRWARAALGKTRGELTLRIVGNAESRRLNRQYRGKDKPTNVLSFAYGGKPLQGDLVVCAPVVAREAREQRKSPPNHWAHMIVHGVLHLRGHDHIKEADAERMEARERTILKTFGIADPYLLHD